MSPRIIQFQVFILFLLLPVSLYASLSLPSLISNNMVLQQKSQIKLWGWNTSNNSVFVFTSWDNHTYQTNTDAQGNWEICATTPKAGGPFNIVFYDKKDTIHITGVMIGEVWLFANQANIIPDSHFASSNPVLHFTDSTLNEIQKNRLHVFMQDSDTSYVQTNNCSGKWICSDTGNFHNSCSAALYFGAYLSNRLDIPIGFIFSEFIDSPIEAWIPIDSIKKNPNIEQYLLTSYKNKQWTAMAGKIYNAMIHPIVNYKINGIIWHQGNTHTDNYREYTNLFSTLVHSWRSSWNQELAFCFVQNTPFPCKNTYTNALMCESQLKSVSIHRTAIVVTFDIATTNYFQKNIGRRLADCALKLVYEHNVPFSGPIFTKQYIEGKYIRLQFLHANDGLLVKPGNKNNFLIAGENRQFYPANIKIANQELLLYSPKVPNPVAVRYAFPNSEEATLFNSNHLPASSFRTDNWDIITSPLLLNTIRDESTKTYYFLLTTLARETDIYYSFTSKPNLQSKYFNTPVPFTKSVSLNAVIAHNGYLSNMENSWKLIYHKALGAEVKPIKPLLSSTDLQKLTDGICASSMLSNNYLVVENSDLELFIDLKEIKSVKAIESHFFCQPTHHIVLPESILIETSSDGENFQSCKVRKINSKNNNSTINRLITFKINKRMRYIRFKALQKKENLNSNTFYIDEIIIK